VRVWLERTINSKFSGFVQEWLDSVLKERQVKNNENTQPFLSRFLQISYKKYFPAIFLMLFTRFYLFIYCVEAGLADLWHTAD